MKQWAKSNNIVVLKADKSKESPEIDQLLVELGRVNKALPYYALMRPNEPPIHFDGGYASTNQFLAQLGELPPTTSGQNPVNFKESNQEKPVGD